MRFLIYEIPAEATYCTRNNFLHAFPLNNNGYDFDKLMNGIQVVDTRMTLEDLKRIENKQYPLHLKRLFDVKDMQLSSRGARALCSISIFRQEHERSTTDKRFEAYLTGLKEKIEFHRFYPDQKLRVYIGDNIWDLLHKEKVLEAKDVDFVRMEVSSEYTEIGTFWRFLAFEDYDYEYVYINETDGHGQLIDGEWIVETNENGKQIGHAGISVDFLNRSIRPNDEIMDFCCRILPIPTPEMIGESIPEDYPLLFYVKDDRLSDPLFMLRLSEYIQIATPTLIRGPNKLPFSDIRKIFYEHFLRSDEQLVYHPESNLWTNLRERHPNLNYRYIDDQWQFHLTKLCRFRFIISPNDFAQMKQQFNRYGENWFLKRLIEDLIDDGNLFLAAEHTKDDAPPLCFS